MYENNLQIALTDDVVKSLKTCEILKTHEKEINSIDFSDDGSSVMTSGKDDLLCVFDVERREIKRKLYNRAYGCENAIFTHDSRAILCSSYRDFRIMYWSLHSNELLFSFLGHSDLIFDISMNPQDDKFLTTSRDKTSRLWDLANRKCLCIFQDSNYATFDDTGKVIASVTSDSKSSDRILNFINLYETENVLKGPFKVFKIDKIDNFLGEIKALKFTNDGMYIVGTTNDNLVLVIDAYDGNVVYKLSGEINENDIFLKADVSADSKYVAIGTEGGSVLIWSLDTGNLVTTLESHPMTSWCVKFSPRHTLLASSCTNLILWHPSDIGKH
jgi:WD40 repeat protein